MKYEPRYYFYDFYVSGWLVERNAVEIKEMPFNDSISFIQIINHGKQDKKSYFCDFTYEKKIYQKHTKQGIYFSWNNHDYSLYYDFLSTETTYSEIPSYEFFDNKERNFSIQAYVDELQEKKLIFFGDGERAFVMFTNNFSFPLCAVKNRTEESFFLSSVIGDVKSLKYLALVDSIKLFDDGIAFILPRDEMPNVIFQKENFISNMKQKGISSAIIRDSIAVLDSLILTNFYSPDSVKILKEKYEYIYKYY
jgi:hypothetical protein